MRIALGLEKPENSSDEEKKQNLTKEELEAIRNQIKGEQYSGDEKEA